MKKDQSFGVIPLRKKKNRWEILLVCHHSGHWGFPKGHGDPGEQARDSAERELFEETGYRVKNYLLEESLLEHYTFTWQSEKISKTVTYFLAEVEGKLIHQPDELTDAKWVSLSEAESYLQFPESKQLLAQVVTIVNTQLVS